MTFSLSLTVDKTIFTSTVPITPFINYSCTSTTKYLPREGEKDKCVYNSYVNIVLIFMYACMHTSGTVNWLAIFTAIHVAISCLVTLSWRGDFKNVLSRRHVYKSTNLQVCCTISHEFTIHTNELCIYFLTK